MPKHTIIVLSITVKSGPIFERDDELYNALKAPTTP